MLIAQFHTQPDTVSATDYSFSTTVLNILRRLAEYVHHMPAIMSALDPDAIII